MESLHSRQTTTAEKIIKPITTDDVDQRLILWLSENCSHNTVEQLFQWCVDQSSTTSAQQVNGLRIALG
jgi:hypothetical protein